LITHKTQPHVFTWLIWAITQGTAVAGIWYGGGGLGAITLTIYTALAILIFFISISNGKRNITKSDIMVLSIAFIAILIWWLLNNPLLAVLLVTGIDLIGYIPTFRKSYYKPWSETASSWGIFALANIFSILALERYSLLTLVYVSAVCVINIILYTYLIVRRKKLLVDTSEKHT